QNGEIYYFNVDSISMVFIDPIDKTVRLYIEGNEKILRSSEVGPLLKLLDKLSPIKIDTGQTNKPLQAAAEDPPPEKAESG
ncbi:MAG: hypothetical protein AAF984_09995, partial [Verrucomicrobiota bacterium]